MLQSENISLKPIIEADPVPFTMETMGWKILLGLVVLQVIYIFYKQYLKYKRNAYRRMAIKEIKSLGQSKELPLSQIISQTMHVLKRTALQSYNRKEVASLEGDKWLHFLDAQLQEEFFMRNKELIVSAVYKTEMSEDSFKLNEFTQASINWIKNHA